ncbi:ornithine carbamoyltransferase [uncultured Kocuria sp.]|uniref:ornithine carbamoyltransferase n=1 Tax=uncultured Kocuria sp. TaxID=259305 RepID=UPI002596C874|nr:ornithine carbamoyltransferase [uncultured Kocuria sp.]MCT1367925.1 ornithine carbamoyltransferase [Rothia sp. p3-SID1597]
MTRHFLLDTDLTPAEQADVLDLAIAMKADRWAHRPYEGPKSVAVIFDKTSTRTRFSFATGIADLGGSPIIVNPGESQLGHKESVADTSKVLSQMVATIVWRTFEQSGLEEMAENATVPVINALSDDYHPCQILADLLTIRERFGRTEGLTMAYLGDAANNMSNSYLLGGATAGMNVHVAGPEGHLPASDILDAARERAAQTGATIRATTNVSEAVAGADIVVTDTWISMGQSDPTGQREKDFAPYQVNEDVMKQAGPEAIFMHCLPAYRGKEVTADVIDGERSVVWQEAGNRVHAQKAIMTWLMNESARNARER